MAPGDCRFTTGLSTHDRLAVSGAGLIVWGSIWGLPGAVLSVPLLTITKILLSHANHPLATYALMLIRCAEAR